MGDPILLSNGMQYTLEHLQRCIASPVRLSVCVVHKASTVVQFKVDLKIWGPQSLLMHPLYVLAVRADVPRFVG